MRELPKFVAATPVGKNVEIKIWRNKKLITKKLKLGRLESSKEFKEKKTTLSKKNKSIFIDSLKISVRDVNPEDIKTRKLNNNLKGSVIIEISNQSVLKDRLRPDEIIIEVQKKKVITSTNLNRMVLDVIRQDNKNLLLTVIDKNNQRRYLGVKLK